MGLQIFINGRPAMLRDNVSFDYVSENRLFSDADDYTLNIAFPLRGCPVNLDIFGRINRPGHSAVARPFDMKIVAGRNVFDGSGIITGVSDEECKVQFFSGRSAENYYSDLDDVFINNLDLGEVPAGLTACRDVPVSKAWAGHSGGMDMVAIPWVNCGTGNIQNNTRLITPEEAAGPPGPWSPGADQVWKEPDEAEGIEDYNYGLSWMPYLYDIAVAVCGAIGFSCDFSSWKDSKWYDLLVCNAVPHTWDYRWATLMPHWSVQEFFRKLEPLVEGCFDFDMAAEHVRFIPYADSSRTEGVTVIDEVIDEFSSDLFEKEEECKMLSQRYVGYASAGDTKTAQALSCQWLVRDLVAMNAVGEFATPEDLEAAAAAGNWLKYERSGHRTDRPVYAWHIASDDRYVTKRVVKRTSVITLHGDGTLTIPVTVVVNEPVMLNNLGPRNVPPLRKDAESLDLEIEFVPAVIDDTDLRRMVFVPLGEYEDTSTEPLYDSDDSIIGGQTIYDSVAMNRLAAGEDDGSKAYFSNIAVGFYPGARECCRNSMEVYPILDRLEFGHVWDTWRPADPKYTLSLRDEDGKFAGLPKVNPLVRFEFSFLSDSLPDVRSVFIIRGHRYVCEKLTATFSASGMSRKIKGSFWRVD